MGEIAKAPRGHATKATKPSELRFEVRPFAKIEARALDNPDRMAYFVDGISAAEFPRFNGRIDADAADSFFYGLLDAKLKAERELKDKNPLAYWQALADVLEAQGDAARGELRLKSTQLALRDYAEIKRGWQRSAAGARPKGPRRSPLRRAIVDAMRPLRAEGLTLDSALRSLTHSPTGALRITKQGARWNCRNEDEDWPDELLGREQLKGLFEDAAKKRRSYRR